MVDTGSDTPFAWRTNDLVQPRAVLTDGAGQLWRLTGKAPLKTTRESASAATRVRRVLIRLSKHTASSRMNDPRPRPSKSLLIDRKSEQHVHPLEQITAAQACPISRHYCCQNQKKDDREL